MQDNEKKPALRFKGFTDPWEQRKVGTLIEDYTEKTVTQNQYPVLTSSQQQGIVLQEDYFADRQVTTDNNVGYYVLPKGYFTYRSRSDTDVFVFNRNNIVDKGIISYYYPVFAPKSCDSNFLLRRLNHGIKKQLSMAAEGTGQKVLAHAKFKNMVVDVPSQSEQEKIGTILEELDTLITLHQRKYEKLVNIKKSMLDKMFPKNGASVPEIRFKGFTDPWEQRKLSDIVEKVTEKNAGLQYIETFTNSAEFGIISQRDFFDHDISKIGSLDGYYVVHNEDFVYNPRISVTAPVGPINRNKLGRTGVMSPLYTVFRPHDIDTTYLEHFFKSGYWHSFMNFNGDSGARSDRFSIKDSVFFEMPIPTPDIEEQKKIGEFLTQLDTLITLHQRKLEKLQNIKKSCLEKMFV
ncbi:restriction endonuclease subunit S [Faecalibacterium prausnitzii]|uniref:restriction endonuclease subunit S n=1 Tax=Faecalibacterium prausnitzii TaxID=853 RepID=UPI0022E3D6F5|nr:restriction endonuclease subunit S [Faecalibacterium prausnitzii]